MTFAIAAVIGLGSTWFALTRGAAFGAVTIGAWTARPRTGTADIDPYARAELARRGTLPIGLGDGVAFLATADRVGRRLDGRCAIMVEGMTPGARYFTLTLFTMNGELAANALDRHGFTSQELLRRPDGSFAIEIGPRARSGNWLPTGGIERYQLMLRLYDTPVGIASHAGRETPMPDIVPAGPCP